MKISTLVISSPDGFNVELYDGGGQLFDVAGPFDCTEDAEEAERRAHIVGCSWLSGVEALV